MQVHSLMTQMRTTVKNPPSSGPTHPTTAAPGTTPEAQSLTPEEVARYGCLSSVCSVLEKPFQSASALSSISICGPKEGPLPTPCCDFSSSRCPIESALTEGPSRNSFRIRTCEKTRGWVDNGAPA